MLAGFPVIPAVMVLEVIVVVGLPVQEVGEEVGEITGELVDSLVLRVQRICCVERIPRNVDDLGLWMDWCFVGGQVCSQDTWMRCKVGQVDEVLAKCLLYVASDSNFGDILPESAKQIFKKYNTNFYKFIFEFLKILAFIMTGVSNFKIQNLYKEFAIKWYTKLCK